MARSRRSVAFPAGVLRVGIDTGGTFTDFHIDGPDGQFILKIPSTPQDPAAAVLEGLSRISAALGSGLCSRPSQDAGKPGLPRGASIVHGTTVGTNALLTRRLPRTAFITTAGFEDLIEIGRQNREHLYDLLADRPAPIVPRDLRFGIGERVELAGEASLQGRLRGPGGLQGRLRGPGAQTLPHDRRSNDGRTKDAGAAPSGALLGLSRRSGAPVRTEPAAGELARLAKRLRGLRVKAIAIGFLHSYLDPRNEREVAEALHLLEVPVTLSHRISGEYREFERFSTAIANAALQPSMGLYLGRLSEHTSPARLSILQSDATTASAAAAAEEPIRTVLSGPAGGALAAHDLARALRDARVLSLDMGGTSTDAVLIDRSLPRVPLGRIGGLFIRSPMIDVRTVGAGGGSIARRDAAGSLRVGPESAGADPGPACYGRSSLATVTDAHIVLGRLGPDDLLGGAFPVDAGRSAAAIARLARALRLSPERTAEGILAVVEATMERALRAVSMEQGVDPRGCALYAFGGAGGLHACGLAERLGIGRVVIPSGPGVFSATGLAGAGSGVEASETLLAGEGERARIRDAYERLERDARARLRRQGLSGLVACDRFADLRYAGQSHEITVPCASHSSGASGLRGAFERAHRQRFGYAPKDTPVEIVTLRVRAHLRAEARGLSKHEGARPDGRPLPLGTMGAGTKTTELRGRSPRVGESTGRATSVRSLTGTGHGGASSGTGHSGAPSGSSHVIFGGRRLICRVVPRALLARGESVPGPARVTEYSATTFVPPGWSATPGPRSALILAPGRRRHPMSRGGEIR